MKIEKQNDGKINIEFKIVQSTADTDYQQRKVSFALVKRYGVQVVEKPNASDIVLGTVDVIYPPSFAKTWKEFIEAISIEVIYELRERGMLKTHRYGYTYLV